MPVQKQPNKAFSVRHLEIFGPRFRNLCFFAKYCTQTNSMVLISNTTIFFFKFQPTFSHLFFFFRNLHLHKFKGADFKYDKIVFKLKEKNTQIKHFWFQVQTFFFFAKLCSQTSLMVLISTMTVLDKFHGADFNYDNIIFKFLNKAFLVPNSKIFIFAPNLMTRQIRGR